MRFVRRAIPGLVVVAAACGGSGGTGPTGTTGHGHITATINGTSWSSTATEEAEVVSGTLAIVGQDGVTQVVVAAPITAAGTVSLNNGIPFANGGLVSSSASPAGSWSTANGGTGTMTVTSFTTSHVKGTFSFTATAAGGAATGTRQVTNGTFDLDLTPP